MIDVQIASDVKPVSCATDARRQRRLIVSQKGTRHFNRWMTFLKVCKDCEERGYSPRDVKSYECCGCGPRGHLKFASHQLTHHIQRQSGLLCIECTRRDTKIRKILALAGSFRCTCPNARRGQHLASNEKCALYPSYAGQKKWPGQNKGVSREDHDFHERLIKRRKK